MTAVVEDAEGIAGLDAGSLSKLVRSPQHSIEACVVHVQGWVVQSPASLSFLMIRYEDLKTHAMQSLQKVYGQLGFAPPDDVGAKAVELSSFANMKTLKTAYNYRGQPIARNFRFMRKGLSGEHAELLSAADQAYTADKATS